MTSNNTLGRTPITTDNPISSPTDQVSTGRSGISQVKWLL